MVRSEENPDGLNPFVEGIWSRKTNLSPFFVGGRQVELDSRGEVRLVKAKTSGGGTIISRNNYYSKERII